MNKAEKSALIRAIFSDGWWTPAHEGDMTADMTVEYPFAPPGMTQSLCHGQVCAHRVWLNGTVTNWRADIERLFGPRDEDGDSFIVVYSASADVHWAGQDGRYENSHVARVTLRDGKISHIREWSNPFKWLYAAGKELPLFRVEVPWDAVPKYRAERLERESRMKAQDMSPEAAAARREGNIRSFLAATPQEAALGTESPTDYDRDVIWLPPEMKGRLESADEIDQMEAWTYESMTGTWNRMDDAIMYETDDPNCFYFETGGYGRNAWLGNNSEGGYMNRYLKYMQLDNDGFVVKYNEYLNPINKMNSINQSIPSFPWLY